MYRTAGVLGACVLTAALLGNLMADAQETAPSATAKTDEPATPQIAEEVRQKLHEPVTLQFKDTDIRAAIEELFKKQNIDFWFDEVAINDASISLDDVEVTCNLRNISARAALKRILAPAKLSWVCEDAGVRITSHANMSQTLFARIYDIADLLDEPEVEVVVPPNLTGQAGHTVQFGGSTPLPHPNFGTAEAQAASDAAAKEAKSANSPEKVIIKLVKELTGGAPHAPWLETDGEGGMLYLFQNRSSKLLIVRQTEQAHADIEDLLNDLVSRQHGMEDESAGDQRPKTAAQNQPKPSVRIITKRRTR